MHQSLVGEILFPCAAYFACIVTQICADQSPDSTVDKKLFQIHFAAYVAKLLAQAVLICEEIGPLREVFKRDREMPRLPYMSESFERPPKEDLVAARISRFGKRVPFIAE